jgi:hypothetical protein
MSIRLECQAGATPNRIAVNRHAAAVKPRTRKSALMFNDNGLLAAEISTTSKALPLAREEIAETAAHAARRRLSVSNCATRSTQRMPHAD